VAEAQSQTETITAKDARELIAGSERVLVLDLRDEEEFGEGHIPGARNVPGGDADALPDELPEAEKVLLCGDHPELASALAERGLEVVVLEGGIEDWRGEKLPEQPSTDFEKEDEGPKKLPGAGT
jgi:rhodanese-related sulfurtransferase